MIRWLAASDENWIPLHWRGAGVGYREPERPTLKADAFCPWNCEKIQNRTRSGGRGSRRASWVNDLLGLWLARRLGLPISSRLPSQEGSFSGIRTKLWLA